MILTSPVFRIYLLLSPTNGMMSTSLITCLWSTLALAASQNLTLLHIFLIELWNTENPMNYNSASLWSIFLQNIEPILWSSLHFHWYFIQTYLCNFKKCLFFVPEEPSLVPLLVTGSSLTPHCLTGSLAKWLLTNTVFLDNFISGPSHLCHWISGLLDSRLLDFSISDSGPTALHFLPL